MRGRVALILGGAALAAMPALATAQSEQSAGADLVRSTGDVFEDAKAVCPAGRKSADTNNYIDRFVKAAHYSTTDQIKLQELCIMYLRGYRDGQDG